MRIYESYDDICIALTPRNVPPMPVIVPRKQIGVQSGTPARSQLMYSPADPSYGVQFRKRPNTQFSA